LKSSSYGVSKISLRQENSPTETSITKGILEFKGFMDNTLTKNIENYDEREWELQKIVIPEIINRLSNFEMNE
jgi:hypothetical protein